MKNRFYILVILLISLLFISAGKRLGSTVYEWENLKVRKNTHGSVRTVLKSPTRSLEMFEIKAVTLNAGTLMKEYSVKEGFDEMIIIGEGTSEITINGKSERLGEGSVVVANQGDLVKIMNDTENDLTYYLFRFSPWKNENLAKNTRKTDPVFKNWQDIDFKVNANGGRRDIMRQPTTLLKELEMHTTQLKEGLPSHSSHVHPDEEIILIRFGRVEESIRGNPFQCGPGSVIFLTNDDDHGIRNAGEGPCEYYAIRWLTY
jgi:mannose-6-phosphate isomerase-like protein (cupin superfamily)